MHTDVGHLVGLQAEQSLLHQGGIPEIEEFQKTARCEPDVPRMQVYIHIHYYNVVVCEYIVFIGTPINTS